MSDWRVRAYPIQVRIYKADGKWALYSRHRDWGDAAHRAYVEARNAHPTHRVELVDSTRGSRRDGKPAKELRIRDAIRARRAVFADSANVAIKADRDGPKERRPAWLTRTESTCNNCGGTDHRTGRCHLASHNFYERGYLAGLAAAARTK